MNTTGDDIPASPVRPDSGAGHDDGSLPQDHELVELAYLAARLCKTPVALIGIASGGQLRFRASIGTTQKETPLENSPCEKVIESGRTLVIPDLLEDPRFRDHPIVLGAATARLYAGAPLHAADGSVIGALCVMDHLARPLDSSQLAMLSILARQTTDRLKVKQATQHVHELNRQLTNQRLALDAHAIVAIADPAGRIIDVNDHFCRISGYERDELIGREHRMFNSGYHSREFFDGLFRTINAGKVWRGEVCNRTKDGRIYWVDTTIVPSCDATGKVTHHTVIRADITQRKQAEKRLAHLAYHDSLTGLPNRTMLTEQIQRHLDQEHPLGSMAVMFLDLDRFKLVNDGLGHVAGDAMLVAVAKRISRCVARTAHEVRPGCRHLVGRLGGDEFCVVLDALSSTEQALAIARRLLEALRQPIQFDGHELTSSASIGIVPLAPHYQTAREMLRDADVAMYRAKSEGKDRCVCFSRSMHDAAIARLHLEADLRHALQRGQMRLEFQPIASLATRQLEGFEALIRWDRHGHCVNPADFIPVAEDTGLIIPIGAWVLEQAAAKLREWRRKLPGLTMAVNLSRRQLGDTNLLPLVRRVLEENDLPPSRLKLEITESMIMDGGSACIERIEQLRALGVQLAMDDFGTGHSSLSCLHRFPMSVLKIDRSFVEDMESRHSAATMVHAVIALAHNLGMTVIAEGLETATQVSFLHAMECDSGQGFYFDPPLDAEAAAQRVRAALEGHEIRAA